METDTYHGWTNRATWLANLWLSNDYDTYQCLEELRSKEPLTKSVLEDALTMMRLGQRVCRQDFEGVRLADINWDEVLDGWMDDGSQDC